MNQDAPISRRAALLAPLWTSACAQRPVPVPTSAQQALAVQLPGLPMPWQMWLQLPSGYHASSLKWPLLIFLHGSGQRGTDLNKVLAHGPPQLVAQGRSYPFILCSPQLAAGRWDLAQLHALIPVLAQRFRVDLQRVSATGLSLGGHGVWAWAAAHPEDLAAIAPVCGFGDAAAVCRGRQVPVRAYHGDNDPVVPLARQQACVDALRACGGTAELTVYPGVGHEAWTPAYRDPGLVPWLLAQRRPAAVV